MTSNQSVFAGCIPALVTPCTAAGQPDFDALAAKGKEETRPHLLKEGRRSHGGETAPASEGHPRSKSLSPAIQDLAVAGAIFEAAQQMSQIHYIDF